MAEAVSVLVRFWAGAQRAAGHDQERVTASTLGDVVRALAARPELTKVCAVASFLVDGQQAGQLAAIAPGDVAPLLA